MSTRPPGTWSPTSTMVSHGEWCIYFYDDGDWWICLSLTQAKVTVPRVGIAWGRVCVCAVQVRWGPSLLRTLYMNKRMLICTWLLRLIIFISFNFRSVYTDGCLWKDWLTLQLFCADNLIPFLKDISTSIPHDWRIINVRFNVGIEEQFSGVHVYDIP